MMSHPSLFVAAMLLTAAVLQPVRSGEIDLFTRDLDLSGLQPPARNPEQRPEVNRDLFKAREALPETLRTPDLYPETDLMDGGNRLC